ncbi:MAG: hypothetical protein PF961_09060 [Planctomycetota bacterium]|jgi:hypothetical protein|nr:hypothetical protein [Planctomycetota bacterium]
MRLSLLALLPILIALTTGCGEERSDDLMRQQSNASTVSAVGKDSAALKAVFSDLPALEADLDGFPPGTKLHQSTYEDGTPLAEGYLNNGKPIGPWRYWHPNGVLARSGSFLGGSHPTGEWKTWSSNGIRISHGSYENGLEVGVWSYWYANGSPSMKGPYYLGERHGSWKHWHPGGVHAAEGNYIRNHQAGMWHQWDIHGRPLSDIEYRMVPTQADLEAR